MNQAQEEETGPEPACTTTLTGDGDWLEKPATSFPPGFTVLCKDCFPDADREPDGTAPDYDHTAVTDTVLRSNSTYSGNRALHRPKEE